MFSFTGCASRLVGLFVALFDSLPGYIVCVLVCGPGTCSSRELLTMRSRPNIRCPAAAFAIDGIAGQVHTADVKTYFPIMSLRLALQLGRPARVVTGVNSNWANFCGLGFESLP